MGVVIGGQGGATAPWIFIHDTDKVEEGLMVLFSVLFFRCPPPLIEIFLPTLLVLYRSIR